jgi:hypothetical protein
MHLLQYTSSRNLRFSQRNSERWLRAASSRYRFSVASNNDDDRNQATTPATVQCTLTSIRHLPHVTVNSHIVYALSSVSLVAFSDELLAFLLGRSWICSCRLSWSGRVNFFVQPWCLHLNGFSPVSVKSITVSASPNHGKCKAHGS